MKKIQIDEVKCKGCGNCIMTCHAEVIKLVDGKAKVVNPQTCDGVERCLKSCPSDAISFIEDSQETIKYDWPIQIKLVPPIPGFFEKELVISATCCGFRYEFRGTQGTLLIGCPKLDGVDYSQKLSEIMCCGVETISLYIMDVQCCKGLKKMVERAIATSGNSIPLKIHVINH